MKEALQITAACMAASLLALFLKKSTPELAALLTLAAAVAAFLFFFGFLKELLEFLQELSQKSGVDNTLFTPLYKTVGIALVVKVGGNLCRDAGESGLASVIETAGAVCALLVALPLLRAAFSLLLELMSA